MKKTGIRKMEALLLAVMILLAALVLPREIWPFCIGLALIACGVAVYRR